MAVADSDLEVEAVEVSVPEEAAVEVSVQEVDSPQEAEAEVAVDPVEALVDGAVISILNLYNDVF